MQGASWGKDARGTRWRAVQAVVTSVCVVACVTPAASAQTRAGVPSPKPSGQAVADQLEQSTGLAPTQVTGRNVCSQAGGGQAQCAAQELVLRQTRHRIHPHPGGRNTFTQVFPSRHGGISPQATSPNLFAPAFPSPAAGLAA